MQTRFEHQGNCFAAAAASILELRLNQVPRKRGTGWLDRWRDWLERFGLSIECYAVEGRIAPRGYSILTVAGVCPSGHAVVCLNGQVVHDPRGDGIERAKRARREFWYVFTVLDASGSK